MSAELSRDIAEIEHLRKNSQRLNVQKILDDTLSVWNKKLHDLNAKSQQAPSTPTNVNIVAGSGTARPLKKITTYAFDESDKYVKLYYTIPGIQSITKDHITSKLTEDSFAVNCVNVDGVDYEINAKGLQYPIDAGQSQVKAKTDSLLVMLKKSKEGQTWKCLLKLENKKEPKIDPAAASGDPQEGLMNLMKKMYDEGDDEMKRTIRKSWHETQSKKGAAGDFDPMSAMGGF